jgi:signal transduction histidine kinase
VSNLLNLAPEDTVDDWIKRLVRVRWIMAIGTALIVSIANYLLSGNLHFSYLLITIAVLVGFNTAIYINSRLVKSRNTVPKYYPFLIHLQILFDLAFLTVFLHFLGGLETYFFFFYLIYVVIVCFLFNKLISFAYVCLTNLMYIGLLVLEWQEVIPHYNLPDFRSPLRFQQPVHIFSTIFTLMTASLLTAYIVLTMVNRLRERGRELLEMNNVCELKTHELMEANLSCELKTKELAELNSRLKKLDEARMQFIWAVTHELRAPSAAIQSYLRLIQEGYIQIYFIIILYVYFPP